jgi:hypothetical protein
MRLMLILLMFVLFGPPLLLWLLRSVKELREVTADMKGTGTAA